MSNPSNPLADLKEIKVESPEGGELSEPPLTSCYRP